MRGSEVNRQPGSTRKARAPIATRPQEPRGKVFVVEQRCKGCQFCVEFCPQDVLEISEEFNAKGYHFPHVKSPERCVNCQLCYYLCPEFAIFVTAVNNAGNSHNAAQPGGDDDSQNQKGEPHGQTRSSPDR